MNKTKIQLLILQAVFSSAFVCWCIVTCILERSWEIDIRWSVAAGLFSLAVVLKNNLHVKYTIKKVKFH